MSRTGWSRGLYHSPSSQHSDATLPLYKPRKLPYNSAASITDARLTEGPRPQSLFSRGVGVTAMASKSVPLTKEGLAKLQRELDHLVNVRRAEVAQRMHDA